MLSQQRERDITVQQGLFPPGSELSVYRDNATRKSALSFKGTMAVEKWVIRALVKAVSLGLNFARKLV